MIRFEIDPDVHAARLPPRELYVEPEWFSAVRDAVFPSSWQFVGEARDVAEPGSVRPVTLLPGSLDEPLLLARDATALRLLSNVCTHRGHLVCESAARVKSLRCAYHGRRFELDGACSGAPGFDSVAGFPGKHDALPRLALEEWRGLLFGSLEPVAERKWSDVIDPVERRFAGLEPRAWRHEPRHDRVFEFDANWCLYVENYLEGLHIPFIHPGLNAKLD
jgi:choline monooxygenase